MSSSLQQSKPKKPGSIVEVLESKIRSPKSKPARYDYLHEIRKPLACLAFVLPLLVWYELSMIFHPEAVRSGVDRLFEILLQPLGPASIGILPLVSVGVFLFWHHRLDQPGHFHLRTIFWIAIESMALALILFLASDAFMLYFDNQRPQPLAGLTRIFSNSQQYGRLLTCLGVGIHEEILFRLLLFAPLLYGLRRIIKSESAAVIIAATGVSILFAFAHCDVVNPEGFPFQASTFLFRFMASMFLCILFRFRGIAIAIGVHAVFDILAIS